MKKCEKCILAVILFTIVFLTNSSGQTIPGGKCNEINISGNPSDQNFCSARLQNDVLIIENTKIARTYKWNNGNIITLSITNKQNGKVWESHASSPDISFPGQHDISENALFSIKSIPSGPVVQAHLEAEILCSLGELQVRRVFRIYPACPAIACDIYLRGKTNCQWTAKTETKRAQYLAPVTEKIDLPGKHWKVTAIDFIDGSDKANTFVYPVTALSYRGNAFRGNLFFLKEMTTGNGIFILKESPTANAQLAYPGSDFYSEFGTFKLTGIGINPSDLDPLEWKRGYGFVTGVFDGNELNSLVAVRDYQQRIRVHMHDRDDMILMNTWGDRNQGSKINEKFIMEELEAGARFGITHLQIDDGWQKGISGDQAERFINIWDHPDYWKPDPARFPNGLSPIMKRSGELGIEVSLWFNPSNDNNHLNWEKDADVLISFYNEYGIRTFKIDGVMLPDKASEINFRKMLDKIVSATEGKAVFNLDVTAGQRGGYHLFNEYGNLYLENRYTDWHNYYPYQTLRNLWMLSRYIPPQNLQIEFLNILRNKEIYKDDPFGPANYTFDYVFAITMVAQPLAFFEASGLPDEAFHLSTVIKKYRSVQNDLHTGIILPIGEEPDGISWTGFQSIREDEGYFLVFREMNETGSAPVKTWLSPGSKIKCEPVLGSGKQFSITVNSDGGVVFSLPQANSYCLYKYQIMN